MERGKWVRNSKFRIGFSDCGDCAEPNYGDSGITGITVTVHLNYGDKITVTVHLMD